MPDLSRGHPLSRPAVSSEEDIMEIGSAMDRAALERRFRREREAIVQDLRDNQGMGSNSVFNGSTKYVNAMLTLLTSLMLAGIVGGISLYANVAGLSRDVKATNDKVDLIINGHLR
jgi:hypothetical protein